MSKGGNLNTQSSDTPFGNADSGLTSSDMTYSAGHVPHALASTKTCYRVAVCILYEYVADFYCESRYR